MRIPLVKPWRAFEEFDDLSDAECHRHVADAIINYPWLGRVPVLLGLFTLLAWPIMWAVLADLGAIPRWIPAAKSAEWIGIQLITTTLLVPAAIYWITRDLGIYIALRLSLRRGCCPKCGQSLAGIPIHGASLEPNPANHWVRCPECGKKIMLLEHGITPRDLVPLELRRADPNLGHLRERSAWRGRRGSGKKNENS